MTVESPQEHYQRCAEGGHEALGEGVTRLGDEQGHGFGALELLASHLGAERPREGWRDEHDRADLYRRAFDAPARAGFFSRPQSRYPCPACRAGSASR